MNKNEAAKRAERITLPEMKSALQRSGYLLEERVEALLHTRGHYTVRNQAFRDPITQKTREIDLTVHMAEQVRSRPKEEFMFADIFIECKNNAQPLVFFETVELVVPYMRLSGVELSGRPLMIPSRKSPLGVPLREYLGFEHFHHYTRGPVATQYCSFTQPRPKKRWVALHAEQHHTTFLDLVSVVEGAKRREVARARRFASVRRGFALTLYYPVLVLQGDMYAARVTSKGDITLRPKKKFLFRKEHFWDEERKTYYVDVVHESQLQSVMQTIEAEVDETAQRAKRRWKDIQSAIAK